MDEKQLQELYKLISSKDPSFNGDVPYQSFVEKMKDKGYQDKMYGWMKSVDPQFNPESFSSALKAQPQQIPGQPQQSKKKGITESFSGEPSSESSFPNKQSTAAESTGVRQPQVQTLDQIQQKQRTQFLKSKLDFINPDLINKSEEYVVPKMQEQFGALGFKFRPSGNTGDWMIVTAPDGTEKEFGLDPFFGIGAEGKSKELKRWMEGRVAALPDQKVKGIEATIKQQEIQLKEQERQLREDKIKKRKMLDEAPKEKDFFTGVFGAALKAMDNPAMMPGGAVGLGGFY